MARTSRRPERGNGARQERGRREDIAGPDADDGGTSRRQSSLMLCPELALLDLLALEVDLTLVTLEAGVSLLELFSSALAASCCWLRAAAAGEDSLGLRLARTAAGGSLISAVNDKSAKLYNHGEGPY